MRIERYFGTPRDIEWAIDGKGVLWFLQARPLLVRRRAREQAPISLPATGQRTRASWLQGQGVVVQRGTGAGKVVVIRKRDLRHAYAAGGRTRRSARLIALCIEHALGLCDRHRTRIANQPHGGSLQGIAGTDGRQCAGCDPHSQTRAGSDRGGRRGRAGQDLHGNRRRSSLRRRTGPGGDGIAVRVPQKTLPPSLYLAAPSHRPAHGRVYARTLQDDARYPAVHA